LKNFPLQSYFLGTGTPALTKSIYIPTCMHSDSCCAWSAKIRNGKTAPKWRCRRRILWRAWEFRLYIIYGGFEEFNILLHTPTTDWPATSVRRGVTTASQSSPGRVRHTSRDGRPSSLLPTTHPFPKPHQSHRPLPSPSEVARSATSLSPHRSFAPPSYYHEIRSYNILTPYEVVRVYDEVR